MTVLRFDPFQEFDRLSRQMLGSGRGPRSMPMEAYRRGDQFFIHLDLPGVNPDDVQLTVERNVVAVRAERRPLWQEGDEVLVDETPQGTFGRQLFLGDNLDAGRLEASFDQGILTLTIPVTEQAKPRRIQVGTRSQAPSRSRPPVARRRPPPTNPAAAQVRRTPAARRLALGAPRTYRR
jgi:HSP20 family protein